MNYLPLPKELRLGFSKIHDIGLFAKEKIKMGHNFGTCHLKLGKKIFRTPLGGFINHSNTPNCEKVCLLMTNHDNPNSKFDYKKWNLITIKDIKKDEEVTLKYTFYNV